MSDLTLIGLGPMGSALTRVEPPIIFACQNMSYTRGALQFLSNVRKTR